MTTYNRRKHMLWFVLGAMLLPVVATFGIFTTGNIMTHESEMYSVQYNKEVGTEVEEGVLNLIAEGRYKCCLKNPCTYCFTDKDHQGRDLVCDCLEDIMNGKHPCGECIGEIMEGEGNPLIAEYFATALLEEVGGEYSESFQKIIEEVYGMPRVQQL